MNTHLCIANEHHPVIMIMNAHGMCYPRPFLYTTDDDVLSPNVLLLSINNGITYGGGLLNYISLSSSVQHNNKPENN